MTTEQIHDSRLAFEKWHLENYGFTPSSQNQVNDSIPADRWRVWQACEAQHQQKVWELVALIQAQKDGETEHGFDNWDLALNRAEELIRQTFGVDGV